MKREGGELPVEAIREHKSSRPRVSARLLATCLLAAWLIGLAAVTLRPSRTLFEVSDGRLVSRSPDWSLFLLDRRATWDGAGRLRLQGRMRVLEGSACVGLTVALSGGLGREHALLFSNQGPDREFRIRVHGMEAGLTARNPPRVLRATPGVFHDCRVEVSRERDHLVATASVDGLEIGTWTCDAAPLDWPCRFGLWCSRIGIREFEGLRVDRVLDGGEQTVLADVRFDREESLRGFEQRVGYSTAPFSLDQVPFVPAPLRGTSAFRDDLWDVVANMVLFLPGGFLLVLLLRGRVYRAVLAAAALSLAIECAQLWVPTRVSSLFDIATNTLGGWAGAVAGSLWSRRPATSRWRRRSGPPPSRS